MVARAAGVLRRARLSQRRRSCRGSRTRSPARSASSWCCDRRRRAHDDRRRRPSPARRSSRRPRCCEARPAAGPPVRSARRSTRAWPRTKRSCASAATTRRACATVARVRRRRRHASTSTLEVEPGPARPRGVRGRSAAEGEREALVPIREERSVDQDLLEDASPRIESALRAAGLPRGAGAVRAPARGRRAGADVHDRARAAAPRRLGRRRRACRACRAPTSRRCCRSSRASRSSKRGSAPLPRRSPSCTASAASRRPRSSRPSRCCRPRRAPASSFRPVDDPLRHRRRAADDRQRRRGRGHHGDRRRTQLQAQLALQRGRPFYRPQLAADRDAIERAYRNQGFQNVVGDLAARLRRTSSGRSPITWTIREGEQITVDRVLINGNARISVDLIRRELTLQPGSPMSDDAHDREPAAAGGARPVPPRAHHASCRAPARSTRDVLVELEEAAATTIELRRRPRGRPHLPAGRRRRPARASSSTSAPRGFFDISRRNLWGKNRSVTLFGRVTLRPREPAIDDTDPDRHRRLRLQRLSRPLHVPRAARVRHDRRRAVHRLRRAGPCARASTSIAGA